MSPITLTTLFLAGLLGLASAAHGGCCLTTKGGPAITDVTGCDPRFWLGYGTSTDLCATATGACCDGVKCRDEVLLADCSVGGWRGFGASCDEVLASPSDCGACGAACASGEHCHNGACVEPAACPAGPIDSWTSACSGKLMFDGEKCVCAETTDNPPRIVCAAGLSDAACAHARLVKGGPSRRLLGDKDDDKDKKHGDANDDKDKKHGDGNDDKDKKAGDANDDKDRPAPAPAPAPCPSGGPAPSPAPRGSDKDDDKDKKHGDGNDDKDRRPPAPAPTPKPPCPTAGGSVSAGGPRRRLLSMMTQQHQKPETTTQRHGFGGCDTTEDCPAGYGCIATRDVCGPRNSISKPGVCVRLCGARSP